MNELKEKLKPLLKKPKVIIIIGISGIMLIFLSSFLGKRSNATVENTSIDTEKYLEKINESVTEIVRSVTGDKSPTVVVTLESGVRYSYADSGESNTVSSTGSKSEQSTETKKHSYITVRDSSGNEKPLLVTETMPQIRGVAIICDGGDDEAISEKIKNAVTAALDITSKRVYISGGNEQ